METIFWALPGIELDTLQSQRPRPLCHAAPQYLHMLLSPFSSSANGLCMTPMVGLPFTATHTITVT